MPEVPPAELFALLDDEYARGILRATNSTAMSAPQLAERLNVSRPTVYRRVERLQELGLLAEATEVDDDGHHRSIYRSRLDRLVVTADDDGFAVSVDRSGHPADRLTEMWEEL
ncbi:ArsR/SmtB family transcription factor [Halorarius halobius]|uniref:ArsR/SmtB family transcription factor n=1 Tax=Halorarius halobius TaxID=2962671 RepID=UPI0020CBE321|nr:winged helix-turn-helix domain-containing protein [Halorarius halobius]